MAFEIGDVDMQVRVVDDRSLLDPSVLEVVIREVLVRLRAESGDRARHDDDTGMWGSVRDGRRQ